MRSPPPRLAALLVTASLAAACAEEPAAPPDRPAAATLEVPPQVAEELLHPQPPEGPHVDLGGAPVAAPTHAELLEKQEQFRAEMDVGARGLLDSFRRRVYEPARDGGLRFAAGTARVGVGDASGVFHVTFDAARPRDRRVTVVAEDGQGDLPARSAEQVAEFANFALEGAYRGVVRYEPPIQYWLTYSRDRKYKIVTAPGHLHDLQVSYRFDERELVSIRGISVQPAAEITNYEWSFFRGRYLLSRFWVHGTGATCDLEYDDRETSGVVLLRRALLQKGESAFVVAFSWERVEAGD